MLAAVLRLKTEKIDPEQTFRTLGLDSLLTVEFIATVNARHATAIKADALLDHPTPLAFARHVARERGMPSEAPLGLWAPAAPSPAPAPASAPAQAPLPGTAARPADLGALLDAVRDEMISVDEALGLLPRRS